MTSSSQNNIKNTANNNTTSTSLNEPSFGTYLKRVENFNLKQWANLPKSHLSLKQFREKRWCYFGIINPELILGSAIVHLGYVTSAFTFVYERKSQKLIENNFIAPPFGQIYFDRHPDFGQCGFKSGSALIDMKHDCIHGSRSLAIDVAQKPHKKIKANITIAEDLSSRPLQLLTPMENGKRVFTQKIAGLKAEGSIETQDKTYTLNPEETFAIFDWTDGYHNRETTWNWASAGGISECGKRIGINFSSGVYTSGFNENAVWINDTPIQQTDITFKYDTKNPLDPWHITDSNGLVDLTFQPIDKRKAKDDFGIIASRFIQPFGNYSGFITDDEGNKIVLKDVGGVVEEHFALW